MKPVEVLNKLRSLKTARSRQTFLKKLSPEHEFWYGAVYAVDVFRACFPVYDAKDPETYGKGVPDGIFRRIMDLATEPNSSRFVHALTEFSKKCTEEEWTQWYGPIVRGTMVLPLSPRELEEAKPSTVHGPIPYIEKTKDVSFIPIQNISLEKGFHPYSLEPFYEIPRALLFVGQNPVAFDPGTGQRIDHPILKRFKEMYSKILINVILDVYLESEEIIIVRDVISKDNFFNGIGSNLDMEYRDDALRQMVHGMNESGFCGVEMIERHYSVDGDSSYVRSQAELFIEQGFNGFVFTNEASPIPKNIPLVVHQTKKNVLTCIDIVSGEDEYAGKVEYLVGRGTHSKKRFVQKIYYGLNWEQRDTYFRDRDQLIGKRFEVLSCGFGHKMLIMPIFQQWRQ